MRLPTRIGLHFGEMSLRIISASHNHTYGATGDTEKRIESINKSLGTNILLSMKVIEENSLNLANHAVELNRTSATARLALSYAQQAQFQIEGALGSVEEAVRLMLR